MLEGIHEAIAIETLGCRPIEGKDIPVKKTGFGLWGELVMVEELTEQNKSLFKSDPIPSKQMMKFDDLT